MRRVQRGEGDRGGIEGENLGFVTIGPGTTLGSRGGDDGTGQRDENSERNTHARTICAAPARVNHWMVNDHSLVVKVPWEWAKVRCFLCG
jgi:hypothetical protein